MDKKRITRRLSRARVLLKKEKAVALFVSDPVNLFFYTEGHISTGILMITEKDSHLILDTRYLNAWKHQKSHNTHNVSLFSWDDLKIKSGTLLFDSHYTTYDHLSKFKKFVRKSKNKYSFRPISNMLTKLRLTKEKFEFEKMQTAAQIAEKAFRFAIKKLKPGVTEEKIEQEIKLFLLQNYGTTPSFPPIVAFGKNSANPHHTPGKTSLKKNQIVLIDLGAVFEHYCSDTTKVLFFGKPTKKFLDLYDIVYQAKQAAIDICHPGTPVKKLCQATIDVFKKHKLEQYFLHSLGHGVGLEIHEAPSLHSKSKEILQPGDMITIEPGLYLPDFGGIRLEDQLFVMDQETKILTKKYKKPLIIS